MMQGIKNLVNKYDRKPMPYEEVSRTACPFYGFNGMFGMMLDSKGNQCALVTGSHSPCAMERGGEQPCWENCPSNIPENREKLENLAENMQVFPEEFHPPEAKSWGGITLKRWMEHILE